MAYVCPVFGLHNHFSGSASFYRYCTISAAQLIPIRLHFYAIAKGNTLIPSPQSLPRQCGRLQFLAISTSNKGCNQNVTVKFNWYNMIYLHKDAFTSPLGVRGVKKTEKDFMAPG
jgi:hypothetical protein